MDRTGKRFLAATLTALLVLTGCASSSGSDSSAAQPETSPARDATEASADSSAGAESAAPAEAAELGGELTVSIFAGDPFQTTWQSMFDRFGEENGVVVSMDAVPYENLREKQAMELASGTGAYDVLYVHPSWFEELASNGYLQPVDAYCTAEDKEAFVPNLLNLYNYEGTVYGLSDWISTQLIAYRTDLFEEKGLSAPQSWDDVLKYAEEFADGDNMYGITFPARNAGALAGIYCSALLSNGGWLVDDAGNPQMDQPAAIETAQYLEKLSKFAPPGYQNFHWDENATVATNGKAAMIMLMTTNVGWLGDPERSQVVDKWGYVAMKNTTAGGMIDSWSWSVATDSANPVAAGALVKYMAGTDVQVQLTGPLGTSGATKGYYEDKALQDSMPSLAALNEAFTNAKPNPTWSTWSSEQDMLETSLQKLFNGELTAEEAMAAVQAKMAQNRG